LELRKREKIVFAGFHFCEALIKNLFMSRRRSQFLGCGRQRTPEKFHRLQSSCKAHAFNFQSLNHDGKTMSFFINRKSFARLEWMCGDYW
jgi:hypothetical protein